MMDTTTSRRSFLKGSAAVSGGLLMGLTLPLTKGAMAAGAISTPNAWVHIADDNTITLISARACRRSFNRRPRRARTSTSRCRARSACAFCLAKKAASMMKTHWIVFSFFMSQDLSKKRAAMDVRAL